MLYLPVCRFVRRVASAPLTALVLGALTAISSCDSGRHPAAPDLLPFPPESLAVTLSRTPDTVTAGAPGIGVSIRAVARNTTARPIVARLECPRGGLVVRVVDPAGQPRVQLPVVCRPQFQNRVDTIPAGDSLVLLGGAGLGGPSGTYRVRAVYEAATGQSPTAELPLVVR